MEKHYSAGGIVIRNGDGDIEVLLIKDKYGHWTWPKGHIEKGETPEEAAAREIREETGLERLSVETKLGEQKYYFTMKGKRIFKTVHVFLVRAEGGEKLSINVSEIDDGGWFTAREAIEKIEYKGSDRLLRKGIEKFRKKFR